jgi:hypothetical protein
VPPDEWRCIFEIVQREAQEAGWHQLTYRQRGESYRRWEQRFNLTHATIKDQILKGFDKAQGIPPSGEAAVHERLHKLLKLHFDWVNSKKRLPGGKGQVDFLLGYNPDVITHCLELESVLNWRNGLTQALWYKSILYRTTRSQALPTLVIFGDCSRDRFNEIVETCLDQRAQLWAYELFVDGETPAEFDLKTKLGKSGNALA